MNHAQFLFAQARSTQGPGDVANPSLVQLAESLKGRLDLLCHPDGLVAPLASLHLIWAVVFIFIGALCLINGVRWHKTLVVLLASLGGVTLGMALGPRIGAHAAITGAAAATLIAIISLPMMRYTIALLSGLAGAFAGANIWTSITLDSSQHLFGAVIGLIVLGMLTFLMFRTSIITFTAILGALLLSIGVLSAMLKISAMHDGLRDALAESPRILPILVGVIAVAGMVIQQAGGIRGLNEAADKADPAKSMKKTSGKQPALQST